MDEFRPSRWPGTGRDLGPADSAVAPPPPTPPQRVITRPRAVALLAVSVLSLLIAAYSGVQTRSQAACQAQVNEQAALSARAGREAAEWDRAADRAESEATKTLILAVFAAKTPEQAQTAFAAYEETQSRVAATRAETDRQRRENPLPPLPSETCG